MTETAETPTAGRRGLFYLWHLQAVGLVDEDGAPTKVWPVPQAGSRRVPHFNAPEKDREVRIALIDNGCIYPHVESDGTEVDAHPNLDSRAIETSIDFSIDPSGTVYRGKAAQPFAGLPVWAADVLSAHGADPVALKRETATKLPEFLDPAHRFSAHGTACAGLIAAGVRKPRKKNPFAMPYAGVNPKNARIVSISTVYSPDYWPVIRALLHAVSAEAEVIVMPRGVEEMPPVFREPEPDAIHDPRFSRWQTDPGRAADKALFEALLGRIAEEIPVVVPSGNDGTPRLGYPARLVLDKAPALIVVGAATARGVQAAYSNGVPPGTQGPDAEAVTCFGPSDDQPRVVEGDVRFDPMSWRGRRIHWTDAERAANPYAPYGVAALDIPGEYGYASEARDARDYREIATAPGSLGTAETEEYRPRALYTLFGGTSAACAIVGGLVSLRQRAEGAPLSGRSMKLEIAASLGDAPDIMEREGIGPPASARVHGMIDAAKLLGGHEAKPI